DVPPHIFCNFLILFLVGLHGFCNTHQFLSDSYFSPNISNISLESTYSFFLKRFLIMSNLVDFSINFSYFSCVISTVFTSEIFIVFPPLLCYYVNRHIPISFSFYPCAWRSIGVLLIKMLFYEVSDHQVFFRNLPFSCVFHLTSELTQISIKTSASY